MKICWFSLEIDKVAVDSRFVNSIELALVYE
jgi:hypothetical protein